MTAGLISTVCNGSRCALWGYGAGAGVGDACVGRLGDLLRVGLSRVECTVVEGCGVRGDVWWGG